MKLKGLFFSIVMTAMIVLFSAIPANAQTEPIRASGFTDYTVVPAQHPRNTVIRVAGFDKSAPVLSSDRKLKYAPSFYDWADPQPPPELQRRPAPVHPTDEPVRSVFPNDITYKAIA